MTTLRSVPAYRQVAETIRREILSGELPPGANLPTEYEFCERFGASRITVRRALQILADEQLIERRQGVGTFVSPTPTRRIPLISTDFSGSIAAHAPDVKRQLESFRWQPAADPTIADRLQILPTGFTLFARRLDVLDGEVVAYDEVHLPKAMADRLGEHDLETLRFLERWQSVQQISLSHLSQTIEAVAAGKEQRGILGVKAGSPLLKETDVFFHTNGSPCGIFISYYRHDLFQLTSTVRVAVVTGDAEASE
jgi:DNA-binding GntR family transcriptional regulator